MVLGLLEDPILDRATPGYAVQGRLGVTGVGTAKMGLSLDCMMYLYGRRDGIQRACIITRRSLAVPKTDFQDDELPFLHILLDLVLPSAFSFDCPGTPGDLDLKTCHPIWH